MNTLEKKLKYLLQESRKVYKDIPRISVFKELEPYKDKDGYYISFTSIEKIGINPQSTFRTPLGIYAYPLKQVWKRYNIENKKVVGRSVPYAGDNPYVWLVKKKDGIKFVNSAEEYTEANLESDKQKLLVYVLQNVQRYYKSFNVDHPARLKESTVINHFTLWGNKAKKNIPVSKLWNITRNLAFRGRDIENAEGTTTTSIITNWNTLFYKVLGYYGFADNTGVGYIHESEPIQAVFFTKTAFDVVKFSHNKEDSSLQKDRNWYFRGKEDIDTRDAVVKALDTHRIRWENGIWENGMWESGIWVNGVWENGKWLYGTWLKGIWKNGTWSNGTWSNGTWEGGDWEKGTWKNGVWKDGWHKRGTWNNGTWENGMWINGTWEGGIWKDGTWKDGHWNSGTWEGGTWVEGWIYDPQRKGNYKDSWEDNREYVRSPISPKKYWAGKESEQPESPLKMMRDSNKKMKEHMKELKKLKKLKDLKKPKK
jgi:hypothetical protein